jgi:hypothetical protein
MSINHCSLNTTHTTFLNSTLPMPIKSSPVVEFSTQFLLLRNTPSNLPKYHLLLQPSLCLISLEFCQYPLLSTFPMTVPSFRTPSSSSYSSLPIDSPELGHRYEDHSKEQQHLLCTSTTDLVVFE